MKLQLMAPGKKRRAIGLPLTDRQFEILKLLAKGMPYTTIADYLEITTGTVKQHVHSIYSRLGTSNRIETVNKLRKYEMKKVKGRQR